MAFKHPDILWALLLLSIPLFLHLFQLRRYRKTPFTNVALLQKVAAESRKSRKIKQWLLLATRLGLLTAFIIAFAQPFAMHKTALQEQETIVYLDNSFSMQLRKNGISLLEKAVQDLSKHLAPHHTLTLFTNDAIYEKTNLKKLQNTLLSIPFSHKQLSLEDIVLQAHTLFAPAINTSKNLLLLSDFQQRMGILSNLPDTTINLHAVPLKPKAPQNIAIDTVHITRRATLRVLLSGGTPEDSTPISLYHNDTLIAKATANFTTAGISNVTFPLPSHRAIDGRLKISDSGLQYDNQCFFTVPPPQKINVIAIGASTENYLKRLYPDKEFTFRKVTLSQLDYSTLQRQHLVVLNHLETIPTSLQKALHRFKDNGGTLLVIPAADIDLDTYNALYARMSDTRFVNAVVQEKRITTIDFQHPLYNNVFEREVTQFQYPQVQRYFKTNSSAPKILALEGGDAFLLGQDGLYSFTAPLKADDTNFTKSPLIVPSFYAIARTGFIPPAPYHTIGAERTLDIPIILSQDQIVRIIKENDAWIPPQQHFPHKVRLTLDPYPTTDGHFTITHAGNTLQHLSCNYPRAESQLQYLDKKDLEGITIQNSTAAFFAQLETQSQSTTYWQEFVILGLLLALAESILQKYRR